MIKENLITIDKLINEELNEYSVLSKLFDEKKQILVKSKMDTLIDIDNKIKEKFLTIKNIEEKRKNIDEQLGLKNACVSDYIKLAQTNSLSIEQELSTKKQQLTKISTEISNKEKTIKELIKQGMAVVNKIIKIIVEGAGVSGQYDKAGKNIQDECVKISSFTEEV